MEQNTTSNTVNTPNKKDNLKKKIKALLSKTTENGASEQEAISALKKANELMLEYYLSYSDLTELDDEKVVKMEYEITSGYDLYRGYTYVLGKLFNSQIFTRTNKNKTTFIVYGLEEDVNLTIYFIKFITDTIKKEAEKFKLTLEFYELKNIHKLSTRRIISNFIIGFKGGIEHKIHSIYSVRQKPEYGLVCVNIETKIKDYLNSINFKAYKNNQQQISDLKAFNNGLERGEQIDISMPLNGFNDEENNDTMIDKSPLMLD